MSKIELAHKTFELLKGMINKYNTNIKFVIKNDLEVFGSLYCRSVLYLNLEKIIKESDDYIIDTNILYIITHELFHAEQDMIDNEYMTDYKYNELKEAEVMYRSITFILINQKYLESELGIEIDDYSLSCERTELDEKYGINNISNFCRFSFEDCIIKSII